MRWWVLCTSSMKPYLSLQSSTPGWNHHAEGQGFSPTNFFPLKKRYQQKDTYVLLSNICSLIFIPKAFDGNEFPTSEENIGITSSFGIEFSLNTFWGSLSFQQLHRPTAKPPADRTCVRTSFAPTLIGVTRVVGARPRGGGRKLLSFTG